MGIFFYGFPPPKSIQAKAITCQTLIFVGKKDKVKYLSDSKTVELAKAAYEDNNLVEIIQIDGDHGFMNPSS
jgi:dienelactone hydrolase